MAPINPVFLNEVRFPKRKTPNNMRKSKKEIISIALAFILVIASIVTMIVKKELDIKLLILTVIMLIINAGEILIAKQGDNSKEYESEEESKRKRDNIINSKVNEKVLNIFFIIVTVAIVAGMIAFKITANLYIVAMLMPLLVLFALYLPVYSLVYWYYWRKYKD